MKQKKSKMTQTVKFDEKRNGTNSSEMKNGIKTDTFCFRENTKFK